MQLFPNLIYIDPPKTASTYVSAFLRYACTSREVCYKKHRALSLDGRELEGKFIFISVRNPIDQYQSLYRFGCAGKGGIYSKLRAAGFAHLYDPNKGSFEDFVRFMTNPNNSEVLSENYPLALSKANIGFLSFRHLVSSLNNPLDAIQRANNHHLIENYLKERVWHTVVRQEYLSDDLMMIARIIPSYISERKAKDFLDSKRKINATIDQGNEISKEIEMIICEKEWLMIDEFYPQYRQGKSYLSN